ncbi:quaternary amine ABC transporter ATP-binding protein [Flaviflexus equikiangi]|uniref:Glycine betaine/L-proline ABC transporter ATP-binding protein n=1 Tax=Flaviflexus equikiangi TaxID=2758573 RepID=A0ABS2TC86_9ACTO|nr:glycine betaine/L-proline ABC transporter ATP-binding protein [Flaviflexus equikiangi]MBM9432255.1 glycine betaine/L-proline ABC transporter ATP-binding protein [Flaviflexus equikiangi]
MKGLRCENVYKVFGKDGAKATKMLQSGASLDQLPDDVTVAVNNVSFTVDPGEIFVVMGLSGSGKSTLLRTLNALGPATGGKIFIGDDEITAMSQSAIRALRADSMSMVFQHFALLPHRTVIDNAAYPLEIAGVAKKERLERAAESLKTTGLEGWENSYPSELSGGMQQRVGLARALTADAPILLMDEAFSALDPLIRRDMQELLLEIQEVKRRTIIFITHDLNEAMFVGNRIAVMRNGSVDQIGTAEEILTNPSNDYIERFVQDVDRSRVITASSIMVKPLTRLYRGDGPNVVLKKLEEIDAPGGWVTDGGSRNLLGCVYVEEILRALRRNPRLTSIEGLIHPSHPGVGPDTPLNQVVAPAASDQLTVPVVSDDNRLLGVIPNVTLLRALGQEDVVMPVDLSAASAASAPSAAATTGEMPAIAETTAEESF